MTRFKKSILAGLALLGLVGSAALAVTPYDSSKAPPPVRLLSTQQTHYCRFVVNFGDPNIGTNQQLCKLPQSSFITDVKVEVVTAFNAGTTNTLTVGTTTSANELVASGDLTGNASSSLSTQVTTVNRGFGRSLTASADTTIFVKYAQTGGAATTGQAIVVIQYIPNNDQ